MGSSGAKTDLDPEKIKSIFLESIKSLPEDQYLCPECDLVPEIINIDYIESEIDLECPKHGKKKFQYSNILKKNLNLYIPMLFVTLIIGHKKTIKMKYSLIAINVN